MELSTILIKQRLTRVPRVREV